LFFSVFHAHFRGPGNAGLIHWPLF
jgi:hypothetical protein